MTTRRHTSPYPMLSIDEACSIINTYAQPLAAEAISSLTADGRVLAEDVIATENLPDVPKAMVDGYALRAADGMSQRRVIAEITAGLHETLSVEQGTAVRIMTGAPLPSGADTVIMVEQTEEHDGIMQPTQAMTAGTHIQQVGQDIATGQSVLMRGTTLGSAEVGLLATIGRTEIQVYCRPRVAVLATGDEVVEPDTPRSIGGVRDSNRYALLAAVREAGCAAISLGIARDDPQTQREAMLHGMAQADVLITSGGVSMGTRDLIKPLMAELGTVHFGRVAFKPGKPTTFATVQDTLLFGLPGFPVSSLVSFEVFVRPALRRLQGDAAPERPVLHVALAESIRPSPDRPEYQRVRITWQDGRLVARSTGGQGSSRLLSLHGANGLLLVPPSEQIYPAGSTLTAMVTGPLGS